MKQYQTFIFDSFGFDEETRSIELRYSLDGEIEFIERLILPGSIPLSHIDRLDVQRALQALHIIGGVSYFKTCLPKKIEFKNYPLSESEAVFWNEVYTNGLGEFFYKNEIKPEGVVNFRAEPRASGHEPPAISPRPEARSQQLLVPIGGGKDSLVTIELLKKAGHNLTLLRMGHHPYILEMAEVAGLPIITIERHLSGKLFDLNEEGALNGHIPITAYLCCLSVVIALLTDNKYVALSNERSADEGNLVEGYEVNHQWSKGLKFETMLNEYLHTAVTQDITIFSMLRPLSELQIARELIRHGQYLALFTSCNRNWHIKDKLVMHSRWCGQCPKCAFGFVLLAAFLDPQKTAEIFGENLFNQDALLPLFRELLGIEGHKPFECVGTAREVAAGFLLAHAQGKYNDTLAMKMFIKEALPKIGNTEEVIKESLTSVSTNSIPEQFRPLLNNL